MKKSFISTIEELDNVEYELTFEFEGAHYFFNKDETIIMKFAKEELLSILYEYDDAKGSVVSDKIISVNRWSIISELIFKVDNLIYRTNYSTGATEIQDESPFQYAGKFIECDEVFPISVTRTEYHTKEEIQRLDTM